MRTAALLSLAALGCGNAHEGDGGDDAGSDQLGAAPCLICGDASSDAPLAVQVKGEIDQVCGSPDGCHGLGAGGMGIHTGAEFGAMIDVSSVEVPTMKRVLPGYPEKSYAVRTRAE